MARKPSKMDVSLAASLDVAALIKASTEQVEKAHENRAASLRTDVDTLSAALKAAHQANADLQKQNLALLELVTKAAGANAELQFIAAKERIAQSELDARNKIIFRAIEVAGPHAIPFLHRIGDAVGLPALPASAAAMADRGAKDGPSALLRTWAKLGDSPETVALLQELAGPDDWLLLLGFLSSLAHGPGADAAKKAA